MKMSWFSLLLLSVLCLAVAVGCVTTKKFEQTVSEVTTRVDGVQTKVEQQSARIDKLEQTDTKLAGDIQKVDGNVKEVRQGVDKAMNEAQEAKKAAKGKVIWQVTLTNRDVQFGADKFELTEAGRSACDQLVQKLKSFDQMVFVEIQGHTDDRGSTQYNDILGMKRAEVVRNYLHDKGIPLNLMSAISYGESRPVAENQTEAGRAQNRRVEILVLN